MKKQELLNRITDTANSFAQNAGDPFYDTVFDAMGKIADDLEKIKVNSEGDVDQGAMIEPTIKRMYTCYIRWKKSEEKNANEQADYNHNLAYRGALLALSIAMGWFAPDDSHSLPF
jgi:hypothetical protein